MSLHFSIFSGVARSIYSQSLLAQISRDQNFIVIAVPTAFRTFIDLASERILPYLLTAESAASNYYCCNKIVSHLRSIQLVSRLDRLLLRLHIAPMRISGDLLPKLKPLLHHRRILLYRHFLLEL